ncbi:MAG TPA: hypothetical protein VMW43_07770 [Bacteroidota bacterium]|nr:hypothetical protein [Bacteroidota bacterium]
MKILTLTGLFAGALLMTIALKKKTTHPAPVPVLAEDERYGIDDLLTDTAD